jgi:hypothetical protein
MRSARWRRKKETSFSEEKEAKRLLSVCASPVRQAKRKRIKVFWFFFTKKQSFF